MDEMVDFGGPFQKAPEIPSFTPHEFPEFQEADLLHFDPAVGLDSPEEIGASPGCEAVSASGVPEKPQHLAHGESITPVSPGVVISTGEKNPLFYHRLA